MDLECQDCGALLHLAPQQRTTTCFFCRSPSVVERVEQTGRPRPAFVLGFVVSEQVAREIVGRWQRGLGWFKEPALKHAPVSQLAGVYLPAYLYGAAAYNNYSVSIGENYTVRRGDRTETRTDWFGLTGQHAAYARDILVTASRGVHNNELDWIEPYDLRALHRYSPAMISGWPSEEPSMSAHECMAWARTEAQRQAGQLLATFMPGNKYRGLQFSTQLTHESLDQVLVPLWVLAVRWSSEQPPVRLLINGQTGRIWGHAPTSRRRVLIAAGVGLGLFVFAILLLLLLLRLSR